jgi:hypothetical protein
MRRLDGAQAALLDSWLARVKEAFDGRILPLTMAIAEEWGRMNVPDPLAPVDGLMAATAGVHGPTLVTRNVRNFERTGVTVLDPWRVR